MVVPPVYGFSAGVWLSYRCTAVLHVHGCPTCVWLSQKVLYNLSERCKPVLPVFVQLVLVYGCPINVCNFFRTMYGFPNSVIQPVRTVYDCPTSAGTTCLNTVLLFYQSLYNLSEHCIVVLPVLVQLVRTLYCCPTSACTTCPNSVWLCYQCLYNLSEQCKVVLPVLVQFVRTVYGCATSA